MATSEPVAWIRLIAETAMPSVIMRRIDLLLVAGFLMLGWTLARMTLARRRRLLKQQRDNREMQQKLDADRPTSLPLSDAPVELQRWQVALFDLQRELKGELDSRIAVIQCLMHQVDEKIARLESMRAGREAER